MNFDLTSDDVALRDGIRELCAKRFPIDVVRKGFDRDGWRTLADAGVFSLRLPEDQGGIGLGVTEAVIVFEELGRALIPGPLVATHVAAGYVDGAATGDTVVGLCEERLVESPDDIDAVLIVDDGTSFGSITTVTTLDSLDPLTPVGRAEATPQTNAASVRPVATVLTAALSSGIASRTTELAVAYAKEREQFGKPIGSFQAVKHMCADMLVRAEVARAAVDAAGVLLDDPDADASAAVHTAKLLASEYALQNAKTCIQVHGGMGFTWEVDAHLYLKRAAVLAVQFGSPDEHAEAVARTL